jgi:hypothetical protein
VRRALAAITWTLWNVMGLVHRDARFTGVAPHYVKPADFDLDGDVDLLGMSGNLIYLKNAALFGSGCPGTGGSVPINAQGDLTLGNPLSAARYAANPEDRSLRSECGRRAASTAHDVALSRS